MIHCYKLGGLNIVLDIFSGSVHSVDDIAFDMIEAFESTEKSLRDMNLPEVDYFMENMLGSFRLCLDELAKI